MLRDYNTTHRSFTSEQLVIKVLRDDDVVENIIVVDTFFGKARAGVSLKDTLYKRVRSLCGGGGGGGRFLTPFFFLSLREFYFLKKFCVDFSLGFVTLWTLFFYLIDVDAIFCSFWIRERTRVYQ